MQQLLKSSKFPLWLGGIVLMVSLVAFWLLRPRIGMTGQPTQLVVHNEGGISYRAAFDPVSQEVNGGISYDYLSAEGVQEYVTFNRQASQAIAQRRAGRVRVNVIFNHPLAQTEFEQFVHTYDVTVHRYRMRAVEADGTRVTISGTPESGQLVPPQYLSEVLSDIEARNAAEFKGWIEAEVTTTPAHLGLMPRDSNVFVTEAAYALIYDALTPQALRNAGATEETTRKIQDGTDRTVVQISGPPFYWLLEDASLVPMPVHSQQ